MTKSYTLRFPLEIKAFGDFVCFRNLGFFGALGVYGVLSESGQWACSLWVWASLLPAVVPQGISALPATGSWSHKVTAQVLAPFLSMHHAITMKLCISTYEVLFPTTCDCHLVLQLSLLAPWSPTSWRNGAAPLRTPTDFAPRPSTVQWSPWQLRSRRLRWSTVINDNWEEYQQYDSWLVMMID